MLNFLPAVGSVLCFGSGGALAKKAIEILGRYRAIVYFYAVFAAILIGAALLFRIDIGLADDLILPYIAQITIGAFAIICFYKALEKGKASVLAPLGRLHVLLVMLAGVVIFGEMLSAKQIAGSLLMIGSAVVIAMDSWKGMKMEKGIPYMPFAVAGWAYYFSFLKIFVEAMGPFAATVVVELGVAFIVIAYHMLRRRNLSVPSLKDARFTIANGTAVSIAALFYNISIDGIGVALTAAIVAGAPIVTAVISYFMLGEKLDAYKYAAIVLMVVGLSAILI